MKIWTLSHWVDYGSDGASEVYAVFDSEEAASNAAESGNFIEEHEVMSSSLRTEYRWRVAEKYRGYDRSGLREVLPAKRYRVNELSDEFGAGLLESRGDFGAQAGFSAPTRSEALTALEAEIGPYNEQEQERLDYLARCTHQFRCPDHGDLSMSPPGNHVGCPKCGRWVNDRGMRFGRYESLSEYKGNGTIGVSFSVSVGAEDTDVDLGPLPDEERDLDRFPSGE